MRPLRHPRAMTILELIVSIGAMVFISGVVLGLYDQTLRASQKMTTRQAAMDFSVLTMDQLTALLGDAIAPTNLDDPSKASVHFGPASVSVPVNKIGPAGGLYLLTLRQSKSDRAEVPFEIEQTLLKSRGDSGALIRSTMPLGGRVKDFRPELEFRYALESRPGEPVKYVNRLGPNQWPLLIEITLRTTLDDYPTEPVLLTTSVIPGRVPTVGGSQ